MEDYSNLETKVAAEKDYNIERIYDLVKKAINYYFKPKSFEKSGELYEALGIKFFRKYLPSGGSLISRKSGLSVFNGKKDGLKGYNLWTKIMEILHTSAMPLFIVPSVNDLQHGDYKHAFFGICLNLLVNVYPIMTQRYNRNKIEKLLEKLNKKR